MQKSKRWKIEDRYIKTGKFDRNFMNEYEGTHMPIHRFRDRRNWKDSQVWIPRKYLEGLLQKYINKPLRALEEAYNRRVKDIPNAESFRNAYDYLIEELNDRKWRFPFKYIIVNGVITKNPEYVGRRYRRNKLKGWQLKYNQKHVKNPGVVRTQPTYSYMSSFNSGMKDRKPIYLGKLYAEISGNIVLVDVYHFHPDFLNNDKNDLKILRKKEIFDKEWVSVKIGIHSLDFYKEVKNPELNRIHRLMEDPNITHERWMELQDKALSSPATVRCNYGLGSFMYPVCKRTDLARLIQQPE